MLVSRLASLAPAHVGAADPTGWLESDWTLQPTVVLGLFAVAAAYLYLTGPANRRRGDAARRPVGGGQRAAFVGGIVTLLVALGPPIDDWADHFLLSVHMVQHLLLTLLAPPLLLLGTPAWLLEPILRRPLLARVGYVLTRPLVAFGLANVAFALWHVPVLYEAALRSEAVHVLEHNLFLGTALLAWWPIIGPLPAWPRLSPPLQCLYFFAQTIPGALIGAFITFAEPGLYRPYDTARRVFGLDLATDQELAGLLMWVATSTIYLLLITVIFFRWSAAADADARGHVPARPQPLTKA